MQCVNCSVTLTYHRRDRRMLCHYCNYAEKVPSRLSASARASISIFSGMGSEKVEEELHREFPKARDRAPGPRYGDAVSGNTKRFSTVFARATTTFWSARR